MNIGKIEGFTRELGKPKDWDDEKQGICHALPIRDCIDAEGNPLMVSAWQPTPEEIEAIVNGEPILLFVFGTEEHAHPVVSVGVGPLITINQND